MKKIQKNAVRFDNLKQDFLDDKKYSGTAESTLNGYRYKHVQLLPMSEALASCLKKYISLWRQDADETAYLFPSFYDEQLSTNALKHSQARYNRSRGVEKTSVHLLRHSFVKKLVYVWRQCI